MSAKNDKKKVQSGKLTLEVRRIRTTVRGGVDEYGQCFPPSNSNDTGFRNID